MKTVNIGELKAHLSSHIQRVKRGEEVLICERNKPVARIVPCDIEAYPEREKRLIAQGILVPPKKRLPANFSWPDPPGNVSREVMERIWEEEREDR
ncbi:MAG: type II toxin-antitoxin system prevent-host-death family antitoxin [Candidatus Korobacteraceae bacterium]